jgi:hypothetical protein
MIDLKRCNYITGDSSSVSFGVNEIIKFLELAGRNIILITRPRTSSTTSLKYFVHNKLEFRTKDDFKSVLTKSNLFRIDLVVVDLWHLGVGSIIEYKSVLDTLGIDYVILAKQYHYKESEDVTDYHIKKESGSGYIITNKINGWSSDLASLIKSYVRDKRIDGIIGEDTI